MTRRASSLPDRLGTGILHFGLGAFHRAHQAPYTEDAIAAGGGDWGIEAIAMRSPALARRLARQGHRFTLIERYPDGPRAREISVIRNSHVLPEAPETVTARMVVPGIHLITITVTEKGYGVRPGTMRLDDSHPAVAHDLGETSRPTGLLGVLSVGLGKRKAAGLPGLTLMSCDNLPSNGRTLQAALLDFTARRDDDLAQWITDRCTFPDSMVDRITPAATDATAALAQDLTGIRDEAAIETEPFSQWVIEDRFAGPRPAWEQAGVQIVDDVAPYELMKLRMLNGAHSLIAYLGTCAGYAAVRDVMANPALARLVRRHMTAAAETLPVVPGMATEAYADALAERFANPAIDHRCLQIAMDGSQKLPQRLFFAAEERLAKGLGVETYALATACWLHHVERAGAELNDPLAAELGTAMATGDAGAAAQAVGRLPGIAETGLFQQGQWIAAVATSLDALRSKGVSGIVS